MFALSTRCDGVGGDGDARERAEALAETICVLLGYEETHGQVYLQRAVCQRLS
jgi:hypothetical protein